MNKKKKIRPMQYYINDKEEMINQIFSCVSEKQINKMTPPTLKDMSIDELKAECLVQLLTMSNNTIIGILEGRKSYPKESENSDNFKEVDIGRTSENRDVFNHNQELKCENDRDNTKSSTPEEENNISSESNPATTSIKRKRKDKKHKSMKKRRKMNPEEEKNDTENKGRNLLELLELEMRAKAIRSLLRKEEELEKFKELNEEPINQSSNGEKLKSQQPLVLKENENVIQKLDIPTIIAKNEHKNRVKQKRIKEMERGINKKHSFHQNSIKETKKSQKNNELSNQKDDKEVEIINIQKINDETKRENYEWNTDEDKLIYEDDEYESDEKLDTEKNKEEEKSEDNSRSSWAERWLQSKDVKKVVATSKMLTVVRNKMKNNLKSCNKQINRMGNQKPPPVQIEGSVKEYDTLLQMHEAVMEAAKLAGKSNEI